MNPRWQPASIDMMEYTGVVRRRWWIVVALILVGVVGGLGYAVAAPKTYIATAAVDVLRTGANQSDEVTGARAGGAIDLDSAAQLVTSATVAADAGKLLKSSLSPAHLSAQVSVTVPPNSEVLDIACGARTSASAASCANAFANAYLANRTSAAAATVSSQLSVLQGRITALQKDVAALNTQITTLPSNSLTRLSDDADVTSDKAAINGFSHQVSSLTGQDASTVGGRIITVATPPGKPTDPDKTLVLPSGVISGLLLWLIGA